MEVYGVICVAILSFIHASQAATTKWPEICRVMSLYRTCEDSTFRIACPSRCGDAADRCTAKNLVYIQSKGSCYGMTIGGANLWPFAMDSCLWYGTQLATLKDASDAQVFAELVTTTGNTESYFLVGALSIGKAGTWVNVDGTEVDDAFWVSSKPSNSEFLCMVSEKNNQYKKSSDNCGQNRAFICEGY